MWQSKMFMEDQMVTWENKFKLATFYFYEYYLLLLAKLITMSVKFNFTDKNYFYIVQFNYTEQYVLLLAKIISTCEKNNFTNKNYF